MTDRQMTNLNEECNRLEAQVKEIYAVASRQIEHIYEGACPDDVEGLDSRDPECPACRVLMTCASNEGGE